MVKVDCLIQRREIVEIPEDLFNAYAEANEENWWSKKAEKLSGKIVALAEDTLSLKDEEELIGVYQYDGPVVIYEM